MFAVTTPMAAVLIVAILTLICVALVAVAPIHGCRRVKTLQLINPLVEGVAFILRETITSRGAKLPLEIERHLFHSSAQVRTNAVERAEDIVDALFQAARIRIAAAINAAAPLASI